MAKGGAKGGAYAKEWRKDQDAFNQKRRSKSAKAKLAYTNKIRRFTAGSTSVRYDTGRVTTAKNATF